MLALDWSGIIEIMQFKEMLYVLQQSCKALQKSLHLLHICLTSYFKLLKEGLPWWHKLQQKQ